MGWELLNKKCIIKSLAPSHCYRLFLCIFPADAQIFLCLRKWSTCFLHIEMFFTAPLLFYVFSTRFYTAHSHVLGFCTAMNVLPLRTYSTYLLHTFLSLLNVLTSAQIKVFSALLHLFFFIVHWKFISCRTHLHVFGIFFCSRWTFFCVCAPGTRIFCATAPHVFSRWKWKKGSHYSAVVRWYRSKNFLWCFYGESTVDRRAP